MNVSKCLLPSSCGTYWLLCLYKHVTLGSCQSWVLLWESNKKKSSIFVIKKKKVVLDKLRKTRFSVTTFKVWEDELDWRLKQEEREGNLLYRGEVMCVRVHRWGFRGEVKGEGQCEGDKCVLLKMKQMDLCYLCFLSSVPLPAGRMSGQPNGLKEWPRGSFEIWRGELQAKEEEEGGREKKSEIIQWRASQESVGGEGEGVGCPACRQHGTGEGAAAFLLAVQEPERQREILWERQRRSRATLHRLLSRPGGGSLPRTHSEILQLQRDAPGLWPWPFTDAVRRQSQGDGAQGKCRVQQARLATNIHPRHSLKDLSITAHESM